jgi:uncharacterized protein (DUF1800 family)
MKITNYQLVAFLLLTIHVQAQTFTIGQGNVRNTVVTSSSSSSQGVKTLQIGGYLPNKNSASRFLSQATLGHNPIQVNNLSNQGFDQWLTMEMNTPNSFSIRNYLGAMHQGMVDSLNRTNPVPRYTLKTVGVGDWHFDVSWFQGAMVSPNNLRWRTAFALSEIFVASRNAVFRDNPYALASYYDVLLDNSFTTYRNLLEKVTYHPTMAVYLTYMNNKATDTTTAKKSFPDENYAREVMQLFSIGLYQLNNDGTEKRDGAGKLIPTYTNDDIAQLAKVFTGFGWGDSQYLGQNPKDDWSYTLPMKFYPLDSSDAKINTWKPSPRIVNGHEYGLKTFLGRSIPARTVFNLANGLQDVTDALNILEEHPNVGPFFCRRMIQRLVSSNPSPEYIGRVVAVFNNNGAGVRGDLKAVIKAILMDYEARDCKLTGTLGMNRGMLREPFVRYMNIMKGLPLTTMNGVYRNNMYDLYDRLEQVPMWSPSVFNFFQADYTPSGPVKNAKKVAPEFQILNAQTLTGYFNALDKFFIDDYPVVYWNLFNNETYKPDQEAGFDFTADYAFTRNDKLPILIDKYNMLLAHGSLSPNAINSIKSMISAMPYEETAGVPDAYRANNRVRVLLYLILSSPDYLINR